MIRFNLITLYALFSLPLFYCLCHGKLTRVFKVPIIPMALVNGSEGLGMGWSTSIPMYNPIDLIDNILRYILGIL